MQTFTIQNHNQFKPYLKLLFKVSYKRPFTILINIGAVISLIILIIHLSRKDDFLSDFEPFIGSFIGMAIYFPIIIYIAARRTFKKGGRLSELITYTFSEDFIKSEGESFSSQYSWNKIIKLKKQGNWLLVYVTKIHFMPIYFNEGEYSLRDDVVVFFDELKRKKLGVRIIGKRLEENPQS